MTTITARRLLAGIYGAVIGLAMTELYKLLPLPPHVAQFITRAIELLLSIGISVGCGIVLWKLHKLAFPSVFADANPVDPEQGD